MSPTTSKVGGRYARQETGTTTQCAGQADEVPAPPPEYPKDKKPPRKQKPPKKTKPPKKPPQGNQGGSQQPSR